MIGTTVASGKPLGDEALSSPPVDVVAGVAVVVVVVAVAGVAAAVAGGIITTVLPSGLGAGLTTVFGAALTATVDAAPASLGVPASAGRITAGGGAAAVGSLGAGTDWRRVFGGGASLRPVPGGFESKRGPDGSERTAGAGGVDNGEEGTRGGGGNPAASAALEPGTGREGVPTESTGMLGIFPASL